MNPAILLALARILGKLIGALARTQTRLLTCAQKRGWQPTEHEAAKLARRQFQLFSFLQVKKIAKQLENRTQ